MFAADPRIAPFHAMLHVIRSNRMESLLEVLSERLSTRPLGSVFAPEILVVPGPAMARWVRLQLARSWGIAANLSCPLPAVFIWQTVRNLLGHRLPERDPLERGLLAWKIFGLLPELLGAPAFRDLRTYLGKNTDDRKRWQLAEQIADVFDRYQFYRPEWIRAWSRGQEQDWQAQLWRRLILDLKPAHRVAAIDQWIQALPQVSPASVLPERVSLFALSNLPPLMGEAFRALADQTQVDLYLQVPTDAFWADLVSPRTLASLHLKPPEASDHCEIGNDLLAAWGRQGQALQNWLLEREILLEETERFVEPAPTSLLSRLQQDIFHLRPVPGEADRPVVKEDDSVQIHLCHSALRECQVLHDYLLHRLETDPGLHPEDILVLVPEIGVYAPYIEAVFQRESDRDRPFLPWNLSDLSVKEEHPLIQIFLQLLSLPESRFNHSEILSYLHVAELAEHFSLNEAAVARLQGWLDEVNLRWGLDGAHKRRFGLPDILENTWAQAEQRLFSGYALGDIDEFAGMIPVATVAGAEAEVLGRFWRLLDRLVEAAERLAEARPARAWQVCIGDLLREFFGDCEDPDGRLLAIREAAAELVDQTGALDQPLSLALVRHWLGERLGTAEHRRHSFSGGVTFCGMRPMRGLPFAVICVLGLNDQNFPRSHKPSEFDRLHASRRLGDPHPGHEDRYLFLETLLGARRCLYLSYVGRNIRDNTERQPAVVVRELLDYIDRHYQVAGGNRERLSTRLTRIHTLQPFSPRNYRQPETSSYDLYWREVARGLYQSPARTASAFPAWPETRLPELPERQVVTLTQLESFLRHPLRHFARHRLRLRLSETLAADDDERFLLDSLQSYDLKKRLMERRLRGHFSLPHRFSAEGLLPHGMLAVLTFSRETAKVARLGARLADYVRRQAVAVAVNLRFAGPLQLTGQIQNLYPGLGLLRWRPGSLRGEDILGLWLNYLAWYASGGADNLSAVLYVLNGCFELRTPLTPDAAAAELERYLYWYWEGLHRPLPVLPKASYAYAQARLSGGDPWKVARASWQGDAHSNIQSDREDLYVRLAGRGSTGNPLDHPEFALLCEAFYQRVLAHEKKR